MAQQKIARLIAAQNVGMNARLLEFAPEDDLGFIGGQYIIVNTGIPIAEGKIAKRAYSILSSDTQQQRFQIAVRRIGSGPGSNYMFDLAPQAELAFSGPWGKYLPRDIPTEGETRRVTTVVATDTGITAAMGLVSSQKFIPQREITKLLWITESDEYFLPEAFVRERIAAFCKDFEVLRVSANSAQRENWLRTHRNSIVKQLLSDSPATVFLSGDGFLLSELRDALPNESPETEIVVESFFHHQELKTTKVGLP
jgi:ferredoxin-NADP reductase